MLLSSSKYTMFDSERSVDDKDHTSLRTGTYAFEERDKKIRLSCGGLAQCFEMICTTTFI
ncbi:hypothetical protein Plhal304r1_c038g0113761 [Plasmopara halstedii]